MSATLLHEARPKARKSHRCSLCTGLIKPGETYQRDTLVFDGRVYDWLTCPRCETDEISDRVAVWSYANQDEGYDAYTAHEWAAETARYPGHPDDMIAAATSTAPTQTERTTMTDRDYLLAAEDAIAPLEPAHQSDTDRLTRASGHRDGGEAARPKFNAQTGYTPTTDEVRTWSEAGYVALHAADAVKIPPAERSRWLDRWLAGIRAEAWDEAVTEARDLGWLHDVAHADVVARNPYRKEQP